MSALVIRLLGRPEIERDGDVVAPPRGHKAWAVLAYLALGGHGRRAARLDTPAALTRPAGAANRV